MANPYVSADHEEMNNIVLYEQAAPGDQPIPNSADDFRMFIDATFATAGVVGSQTSLQVTPGLTPSTTVTVNAGYIILPKWGGGYGKYVARLNANMQVSIPAPPASGVVRTHKIVAYALDKADAAATPAPTSYGWAIQVLEDTGAGTDSQFKNGMVEIGTVKRTGGVPNVTQADIGDTRPIARADLTSYGAKWQVFSTVGTSTWYKPFGARTVWVRAVGGGGGGGGCLQSTSGSAESTGGGGGGGGYAEEWYDATLSTFPSAVTVTVGRGGPGGTSGTTVGYSGDPSKFGTFLTGNGGAGGERATAVNANTSAGGGGGGGASGGTLNIAGGDGGTGQTVGIPNAGTSTTINGQTIFAGGSGGSSTLGGSQRSPRTDTNGYPGQQYGGGGTGGRALGTTHRSGGPGAAGVVIVVTYF